MDEPQTTQPEPADEDDTEGQAFRWQVVADPKKGSRLSAGWTPDEPQGGRNGSSGRVDTSTKGKSSGSR